MYAGREAAPTLKNSVAYSREVVLDEGDALWSQEERVLVLKSKGFFCACCFLEPWLALVCLCLLVGKGNAFSRGLSLCAMGDDLEQCYGGAAPWLCLEVLELAAVEQEEYFGSDRWQGRTSEVG